MTSDTFCWSTLSWPALVSEGPSRWYLSVSCSSEGVREGCGRVGRASLAASTGSIGGGGISPEGELGVGAPDGGVMLEPSEAEAVGRERRVPVHAWPERFAGTGVLFIVRVESREMNRSLVNDAPGAR